MSNSAQQRRRRSGRPLWLVEGLDIVEQRRGPLLGAVAIVVLVPLLLAIFAPTIVPPTPLVGVAVAIAALLLGIAAALAADTTDLIVRGPRHVGAAGGELVAILPTEANPGSARALAASVLEAREPGTQLLLGIAGAGREALETAIWTDALANALVRSGVSVLRIDLASGRTDRPGLAEVVKGDHRLTDVVDIEPGRRLARLGTGGDPIRALRALPNLPGRLPADLDVLLVALPSATNREVVNATRALDHMLLMTHRDSTSRVQLIAALDALDSTGATAQVVLVDDRTVARLRPGALTAPGRLPAPPAPSSDEQSGDEEVESPEDIAASGAEPEPDLADSPANHGAPDEDGPVEGDVDGHDDDEVAPDPDAEVARDEREAPSSSHVAGITGVGGGAVVAAQLAGHVSPGPADEPASEEGQPELDLATEKPSVAEVDTGEIPQAPPDDPASPAVAEEPGSGPEGADGADRKDAGAAPAADAGIVGGMVAGADLAPDAPSSGRTDAGSGPFGDWVARQTARDDAARRVEREQAEHERAAQERAEQERAAQEQAERERAERKRVEQERAERAAREEAARREEATRAQAAREEAGRQEAARAEAADAEAAHQQALREDAGEAAAESDTAASGDAAGDGPDDAGDDPRLGSEPREVDVLLGAAEEMAALAIAAGRTEDQPPPAQPSDHPQTADDRSATDPAPASAPPPAADLAPPPADPPPADPPPADPPPADPPPVADVPAADAPAPDTPAPDAPGHEAPAARAEPAEPSDTPAWPPAITLPRAAGSPESRGGRTARRAADGPSTGSDRAADSGGPAGGPALRPVQPGPIAEGRDHDDIQRESREREGRPHAGEEDSTDELLAVRRPAPIRPAEAEQEDLLRTTAQLAVLMDDLDVRMDEDPPAP